MRRILRGTCCSAFIAILVAAAGQTVSAKTVINYWDKWSNVDGEVIKSVVQKFNASQKSIEVKYTYVDGGSIQQKFLTTMMAGVGPDLVGQWNHRLPFFQSAGLVEPLDSYLKQAKLSRSSFLPNYWDMMTYGGKVYGLPVSPSLLGLFMNKTVLAESGLDPETTPRTVDEMVFIGEKVSRKDASGRWTRVGFDLSDPGYWPYLFPVMFGADLYNEKNNTVDLNQPGLAKSLNWVSSISQKWGKNVHSVLKAGGWLSATSAFNTGKVAMQIDGSWLAMWVYAQAPKVKFNFCPIPTSDSGRKPFGWGEADIIFLPKGKHRKEAVQFLMYMMKPEVQRDFLLKRQTFSTLKAANTKEFFKANKNPDLENILKVAGSDNVVYAPRSVAWADLEGIYSTAWWDCWNQKKSPAQAIAAMSNPVDAAIKKALRRKK